MKRACSAVCVVVILSSVAGAAVIYNNLDAGTDFFDGVCVVPGESAACFGPLADSFTTTADSLRLTSVGVLLRGNAGSGQITAELLSDDGGKPGADLLELGIIKDGQLTSAYQEFFFPESFGLAADTRYWIKLSDSSAVGETSADWGVCIQSCQSDLGVPGEFFANGNKTLPCTGFPCIFPNRFGPYQMEVAVSTGRGATSEPATWLLVGSGLAAMVYGSRKFKA